MPSAVSAAAASKSTPQFTDAELSEIFQINFSEIFGSAADAAAGSPISSGYKGIQLPSPKATHRSRGQPPLRVSNSQPFAGLMSVHLVVNTGMG